MELNAIVSFLIDLVVRFDAIFGLVTTGSSIGRVYKFCELVFERVDRSCIMPSPMFSFGEVLVCTILLFVIKCTVDAAIFFASVRDVWTVVDNIPAARSTVEH